MAAGHREAGSGSDTRSQGDQGKSNGMEGPSIPLLFQEGWLQFMGARLRSLLPGQRHLLPGQKAYSTTTTTHLPLDPRVCLCLQLRQRHSAMHAACSCSTPPRPRSHRLLNDSRKLRGLRPRRPALLLLLRCADCQAEATRRCIALGQRCAVRRQARSSAGSQAQARQFLSTAAFSFDADSCKPVRRTVETNCARTDVACSWPSYVAAKR